MNSGGTKFGTKPVTIPLTFSPPDVTEATLSFSVPTTWTESELTINIKSSYNIVKNSKIEVDLPIAFTDSSGSPVTYIESSGDPGCTAVSGIDAGVSCNFNKNERTLTISGGFPAEVSAGTVIQVKVGKFFTPISTSTYSGVDIWLTSNEGKKYMKKKDLSIKVDNPSKVKSLNIVQSERVVGSSGSLICYLTLSGHVTSDFWLEITTASSSGLDFSNSALLGYKKREDATKLTVQGGGVGGVPLNNPSNVIFITNVKNRNWVQPSEIVLNVYDSSNKIAQKSDPVELNFNSASISKVTATPEPKSLGTDTVVKIVWEAASEYETTSKIVLTTPSEFSKFTLECKNGANPANCDKVDDVVTVSPFFLTAVKTGDSSDLRISGMRIPYCAVDSKFEFIVKTSDDFDINTGEVVIKSSEFEKDKLTFEPTTPTSQVSGKENTMSLNFKHNSVLKTGSKIIITLDEEITWLEGTSKCSVTAGLASGAACSHDKGVLTLTDGLTSDRVHGGVNIIIQLAKIGNPRALGTYKIKVGIETGSGAVCTYAEGEASFTITQVESISASMTPTVNNRNLYSSYRVVVESIAASWVNTDYIEVLFPSDANMAFSESLSCKPASGNLVSTTCSSEVANKLKVETNVNSEVYKTNKKFEFDVEFIQNPDVQTTLSGFQVDIKTNKGNTYLQGRNVNVIYAGYVSPSLTNATFFSKMKGDDRYVTVNINVDAYIPKGGEFELEFVDSKKFELLGNETLKSSTPSFEVVKSTSQTTGTGESGSGRILIDTENRKLRLKTTATIQPKTDISFELNMRNPLSNTVAGPDLVIRLFLNNRMVFENTGFSQQYNFTCDPLCTDCEGYYYHCTSCIEGKVLNGKICGDPVKETLIGTSIPFLFTFSALVLFLIVWIVGKYRRNRNFTGNYYSGMLKLIYFPALIIITIFFAINKDPVIYTFLMIFLVLAHIGVSWMSARSFLAVQKSRKFGGCQIQGIPLRGKPNPIFFHSAQEFIFHQLGQAIAQPRDKNPILIKRAGEEKEKEKIFKIFSHQIFLIFFNSQVTRIFFSSVSKGKTKKERKDPVKERALFWTWNQESFEALNKSYDKHRNYYMLFQFVVIIILIFSCLGIGETEAYIYLFKFDLGAITLIDILAYTFAYNELHPRKKKPGKKANEEKKKKLPNKVVPVQNQNPDEDKEESVKIFHDGDEEFLESPKKKKGFEKFDNKIEMVEKDDDDGGFPEIDLGSNNDLDSIDQDPTSFRKNVRQNSIARSNAMNSDSFMSNLVIGTTKNLDSRNSQVFKLSDKDVGLKDAEGYFLAKNGKSYKFDEEGVLMEKGGGVVPEGEKVLVLEGIDVASLKRLEGGSEGAYCMDPELKFNNRLGKENFL